MTYIVLGASAAGINGAETLRALDPHAKIILISEDTKIYSRCMLHYYISGDRSIPRLNFKSADFFQKNNIEWLSGKTVKTIDEQHKTVVLESGEQIVFDKLLIATGASAFIPSIPGLSLSPRVFGVRTLNDCDSIKALASQVKNVVVIGGGLIGADIMTGLSHFDINISLIEVQKHMMFLQLDHFTSKTYEDLWQKRDVNFYFDSKITRIILDDKTNYPTYVEINDEQKIPVDFIVIASRVSPNSHFMQGTSVILRQDNSIQIDKHGQTSNPDIYAAGDVTGTAAIWSVAVKEAIVAAHNMVGEDIIMDDFFVEKSTMNFFGIPTMSLGQANPAYSLDIEIPPTLPNHYHTQSDNGEFSIEISIDPHGNYKKIVHKDGKIYGALLQGDLSYAGVLTQLIKEKIDVSRVKKPLFDIDYADFFNIKENLEYTYDT